MIAVIELGGKQHLVKPGDLLLVEKLNLEKGKILSLKPLLSAEASNVNLGTPYATGKVTVEVVDPEVKGDKIRITKFRPKNRYQKTIGHRQRYSQVKIKEIV